MKPDPYEITWEELVALEQLAVQHLYGLPRNERWMAGIRLKALRERINGTGWQCARLLTQTLLLADPKEGR